MKVGDHGADREDCCNGLGVAAGEGHARFELRAEGEDGAAPHKAEAKPGSVCFGVVAVGAVGGGI